MIISLIAGFGLWVFREHIESLPQLSANTSLGNHQELTTGKTGNIDNKSLANPEKAIFSEGTKININIANAEELAMLPGIGPVTAERIIKYRIQQGLFKKPDMILNVKGIGPKTFEKIKDYIIVDPMKEEK